MSNIRAIDAAYQETLKHLDGLRTQQALAERSCARCQYGNRAEYSYNRKCRHPFVRRGSCDVVTGKTSWSNGRQDDVRRGLCGPQAALFELAPLQARVWRSIPEMVKYMLVIPSAIAGFIILSIALLVWLL